MKKELLTRFMEKRIVELKKEQRNGTAHVYQSTLNRLKNFMNGREITFSQLTPEWLALFEQKLLADQLKWNTISTYMRMLRSVYNQALERGVICLCFCSCFEGCRLWILLSCAGVICREM